MTCVTLRTSLPAGAGLVPNTTPAWWHFKGHAAPEVLHSQQRCVQGLWCWRRIQSCLYSLFLGEIVIQILFSLKETDVTWWVQTSQVLEALDETLRDVFSPETWFYLQDEKLAREHQKVMLDPRTSLWTDV